VQGTAGRRWPQRDLLDLVDVDGHDACAQVQELAELIDGERMLGVLLADRAPGLERVRQRRVGDGGRPR
jgi:hypothetical protein